VPFSQIYVAGGAIHLATDQANKDKWRISRQSSLKGTICAPFSSFSNKSAPILIRDICLRNIASVDWQQRRRYNFSLFLSLTRSLLLWNASRFDPSTISPENLRDCRCNSNQDTREITGAISRQPFSLLAEHPERRLLFSTLSMSKGTQGRQILRLFYPVLVILTVFCPTLHPRSTLSVTDIQSRSG